MCLLQALFSCNLVFQKRSGIFGMRKMKDYVQEQEFNARGDLVFFYSADAKRDRGGCFEGLKKNKYHFR